MTIRLGTSGSLAVVLTVLALCWCGSSSVVPPAQSSGNAADGGSPCPPQDASAAPTGACTGSGSCTVVLQSSCGPGVKAVPETPPVYSCECAGAEWSCVLVSDSLGVIVCGDADTEQ